MAATGKITSRYERVRDIRRDANNNENAFGAVYLWEFLPRSIPCGCAPAIANY